jgi:4-hydroxy-2-oxoheptanedioate aldolase
LSINTTSLTNTALRKMLDGQPAIGVTCGLGSPIVAEMLSRAGFDFVLVDNQHGVWNDETTAHAFRYICLGSAIPMARVSWNDFGAIGRLLDRGAMGIIVPMVNTVEEAQRAAFAARFPPRGGRSTGGVLSVHYGPEYDRWINDQVFLAVQIETVQAVENAEAILSVDGVDGCWIGPADLAKSMGVDRSTPEGLQAHRAMVLRVVEACRKAGKIAGISGDIDIRFWLESGFQFVTMSYDGGLLLEGAKRAFEQLQAAT